jgi:hypothetical protein
VAVARGEAVRLGSSRVTGGLGLSRITAVSIIGRWTLAIIVSIVKGMVVTESRGLVGRHRISSVVRSQSRVRKTNINPFPAHMS